LTNHDRADRLIAEASEILRELSGLLRRRAWNLTVRRAQEAVELTLKALLAEVGADYPKVHDVAPQFASVVRARGLDVAEADLARLQEISGRLAAARAPAFYFEAEFVQAQAVAAARDAEFVVRFGTALISRLRSST